jgi:hypothetical protein
MRATGNTHMTMQTHGKTVDPIRAHRAAEDQGVDGQRAAVGAKEEGTR